MFRKPLKLIFSISTLALPFIFSGVALSQDPPSAAVEQGALAWNNWTKTDAGGTGALPAEAQMAATSDVRVKTPVLMRVQVMGTILRGPFPQWSQQT